MSTYGLPPHIAAALEREFSDGSKPFHGSQLTDANSTAKTGSGRVVTDFQRDSSICPLYVVLGFCPNAELGPKWFGLCSQRHEKALCLSFEAAPIDARLACSQVALRRVSRYAEITREHVSERQRAAQSRDAEADLTSWTVVDQQPVSPATFAELTRLDAESKRVQDVLAELLRRNRSGDAAPTLSNEQSQKVAPQADMAALVKQVGELSAARSALLAAAHVQFTSLRSDTAFRVCPTCGAQVSGPEAAAALSEHVTGQDDLTTAHTTGRVHLALRRLQNAIPELKGRIDALEGAKQQPPPAAAAAARQASAREGAQAAVGGEMSAASTGPSVAEYNECAGGLYKVAAVVDPGEDFATAGDGDGDGDGDGSGRAGSAGSKGSSRWLPAPSNLTPATIQATLRSLAQQHGIQPWTGPSAWRGLWDGDLSKIPS